MEVAALTLDATKGRDALTSISLRAVLLVEMDVRAVAHTLATEPVIPREPALRVSAFCNFQRVFLTPGDHTCLTESHRTRGRVSEDVRRWAAGTVCLSGLVSTVTEHPVLSGPEIELTWRTNY